MSLQKHKVCKSCLSPALIYADCVCVYQKGYPTIELEFEVCDHCGNIDNQPADTEFNDKQLGEEQT